MPFRVSITVTDPFSKQEVTFIQDSGDFDSEDDAETFIDHLIVDGMGDAAFGIETT